MSKAIEIVRELSDNPMFSIGIMAALVIVAVGIASCAENYGKSFQHVVTVTNVVNRAEEPKDK